MSMTVDARRLAWEALQGEDQAFPTRRLEALCERHHPSPADRALAMELLRGVLRRRATLDANAQAYAKGRIRGEAVQWALRLGLLQLFFLDHIPAHAAVSATMEATAPELGGRKAFVHAVLRGAARGAQRIVRPTAPSPRDLPDAAGAWQFDRAVFPADDPLTELAARASYPRKLLQRWQEAVGEAQMRARAEALNQPPLLWVRINPLRAEADQVMAAWQAEGISCQESLAHESGAHLLAPLLHDADGRRRPLTSLPGFAEGWWSVQDLTSFESLALAAPRPGERVLDLCAAPGGKAFAAWELMGGEGELWACDVNPARLAQMRHEAQRLGHELHFAQLPEEAPGADMLAQAWDLLVADVPCSNTGVLHKRPEARWRFSTQELHRLTTLQNLFIKGHLLPLAAAGGRVLWSSCSLEPEEDQEAVARLAKKSGLALQASRLFEPDARQSGGFAAILAPQA